MDGRTRRVVEMGKRVVAFFDAHREEVPADLPPLARLKEILARAEQLMLQQRDGITDVRAATAEKRELRRKIRQTQLPYFSRIAEAAGVERPELVKKFDLPDPALPYLAFQSVVQGILAEAQAERELLARYGLLDSARKSLADMVGQFVRAAERSLRGRQAHVGARAELEAIADEILQRVRQLDGLARFRFASDAEALATWRSASNTIWPARSGGRVDGQAMTDGRLPDAQRRTDSHQSGI
jgi:hypothetical protein